MSESVDRDSVATPCSSFSDECKCTSKEWDLICDACYRKTEPIKPRCFALDFDDTFTADPWLWSRFVRDAIGRGHRFYCVTARRDSDENVDLINKAFDYWGCQMPIIFANLSSKVTTMERRGIKVDIWIDDAPFALVHGH